MTDFVSQDGFTYVFAVFLRVKLGGVDADDDDLIGVLLLQLGQVGQRMNAVDAAERPEVEDDDLAAQVFEFDGAGGVEPTEAAFQFGGWMTTSLFGRRRFVIRGRAAASCGRASWLAAMRTYQPVRAATTRRAGRSQRRRRRNGARTGAGEIGASDINSLLHKERGDGRPLGASRCVPLLYFTAGKRETGVSELLDGRTSGMIQRERVGWPRLRFALRNAAKRKPSEPNSLTLPP